MARRRSKSPVEVKDRIGRLLAAFVVEVRRAVGDVVLPEVARALDGAARRTSATTPTTERAASRFAVDPVALDAFLARVVTKHALSAREAAILSASAHGVPRPRLSEALGTSENTIKTQVRSLLRKLGQRDLDDAVWSLRGTVTVRGRGGSRARRRR